MTWQPKTDCPGRACMLQPVCTSRSAFLHPSKFRSGFQGYSYAFHVAFTQRLKFL